MTTVSDSFNRANEIYMVTTIWSKLAGGFTGDVSIISNAIEGNGIDGPRMYDGGTTWGDDQSSEITVFSAGTHICGPMVRCGTGTGYMWQLSNGQIKTATAGAFGAAIATRTATPFSDGDKFKLVAVGGLLKCYKNGVQVGANITDSTYSSGKPGVYTLDSGGRIDAWTGTDQVIDVIPINRVLPSNDSNKSQGEIHDPTSVIFYPQYKPLTIRPI